ncbi:MAG: ABC transporter substrate-binding protein [Clostridia bacterium]|nr:ABC transporter substrate-binding protein [Clostridia bacterium]
MKRFFALLMAAAMVLAMAVSATATAADDTLRIRVNDSFATLDPQGWALDTDRMLCRQVYEPLVEYADDTTELFVLASGYTISDDGKSYTFALRSGVNFSNGDPMTASDVKFSIERAKNSAYLSSMMTLIESVVADDAANTVTVTMPTAAPGLIEAMSYVYVVNQDWVEQNADETGALGVKTCGTGAYMLKDFTQDVSVTFEKNPGYWGTPANIANLQFMLVTDENTALTAFQAGELDVAKFSTNSQNWAGIKSNAAFTTAELATNHVTYFVFNMNQAPFNDVRVRQAIACAANREDMILFAMDGFGAPTYSVVTPYMTGYAEIEPSCNYDLDRAAALLAEAGYPNGAGLSFELQTLAGSYFEDCAVALQGALQMLGIDCTVTPLEANTLIGNGMSGSFQMLTIGQSNTYDMNWLSTYYGTESIGALNMAQYSDAAVDEKMAAAAVCTDAEARVAMYKDILTTVDAACAYLPLFNKTLCVAWNANLDYAHSVHQVPNYAVASWK